jgi:colicin import membrane protein
MAAKLKSFVTESGFFELAVAAPSRAAALRAWGMKHDLFAQGLARQASDKATIETTMAKPGTVLRRPLGSKGPFREDAELPDVELPDVKGIPKRKKKTPARKARHEQQEAARALDQAEAAYRQRIAALHREREEVQTRIDEVSRAWKEQQKQFKTALRRAKSKA